MVRLAHPRARVLYVHALLDGMRNANFKLTIDGMSEPLVLRVYEHDASLCQKEVDLLDLVRASVPVPHIVHAEPRGHEDLPPFALLRWVDGTTFRDLRNGGDREATDQAARCIGESLAAIHRVTFPKPGWLAPGPRVTDPLIEGDDPIPRFIDACLTSPVLQRRVPVELRTRAHEAIWSQADPLARLGGEARLVHGDFGKRNVILRERHGRWTVGAVLDWEFAVASTPLADVGHFLRHEAATESPLARHFSAGYRDAGGSLPTGWPRLARLVDLTALCQSLTEESTPAGAASDIVQLVRATVENSDPCDGE